ncbi:MAG TPA: PASTA domain-containing protein, partial [Rhodothermales bacterium]
RVYLTVNSGETPTVTVPRLEGFSPREASNQLRAVGLALGEVRADSIPHPYQNTVTRQSPAPGAVVREGESVTIWVSTGPGDEWVTVPSVTGMTVSEAQQLLLEEYKLRSRILGAPDDLEPEELGQMVITRQSNEGARVRQGYEVRLHVDEPDSAPDDTSSDA